MHLDPAVKTSAKIATAIGLFMVLLLSNSLSPSVKKLPINQSLHSWALSSSPTRTLHPVRQRETPAEYAQWAQARQGREREARPGTSKPLNRSCRNDCWRGRVQWSL